MTEPEKQLLADFQSGVEKVRLAQALSVWGVPKAQSVGVLKFFDFLTTIGEQPADIRTVTEGDILEAGQWSWQVNCYGGHSPAGLCLTNADGVIFSGDHVLANISPNPEVNLQKERPQQGGLPNYIRSLEAASQGAIKLCLPGHGPIIHNFRARLQVLLQETSARQREILTLVGREHKSIYQLTGDFLISLGIKETPSQLGLALNEVKAHLDLLEQNRQVHMLEVEGVYHYQLASRLLKFPV